MAKKPNKPVESFGLFTADTLSESFQGGTILTLPVDNSSVSGNKKFDRIWMPDDPFHVAQPLIKVSDNSSGFRGFPAIRRDVAGIQEILAYTGNLGLDLEFNPKTNRPSVLGLASRTLACAIPWDAEIMRDILRTARVQGRLLVGHSVVGADRPVVEQATGIKTELFDWRDSMLTHWMCNADFCKGVGKEEDSDDAGSLGYMNLWTAASMVLSIPKWKECVGSRCLQEICPRHDVWGYCATDAWAGLEIYEKNTEELDRFKVPEFVRLDMLEMADIAHRMEQTGIAADRKRVNELRATMAEHKDAIFEHTISGKKKDYVWFNPQSSEQVITWFGERGVVLEANDKKNALKMLEKQLAKYGFSDKEAATAAEDIPEVLDAALRLYEFKESGKGPDPWFGDKYFGKDGLLHPRWIVTGTSSGRWASSKPNFTNIGARGWAKQLKTAVVPQDPDCDFVESDASQLELRVFLWAAGYDPGPAATVFEKMVEASNGALDRAAEIGHSTPRNVAKTIVHACLTGDHEVLTPGGWRRIDTLRAGTIIAQWNTRGNIEWTIPTKLHRYEPPTEGLFEIRGRGFHTVCTKDHKFPGVVRGGASEKWHRAPFPELPHSCRIPVCGNTLNTPAPYSDQEIRQAVAVQADGNIAWEPTGYTVFHLVKARKQRRLEELFSATGVPCCATHTTGKRYAVYFKSKLLSGKDKTFTSELLRFSSAQMQVLLDELRHWDGCEYGRATTYHTNNYENAVLVQTVAHLSGSQALLRESLQRGNRKLQYRVSFNRRKFASKAHLRVKEHDTEAVFCVTTQSSFFLVRYRDTISITGNTDYGESIKLLAPIDLMRSNIKADIDAGALEVHKDWEYCGKIVAFTGSNLAERVLGSRTRENRALALKIRRTFLDMFPGIERLQRQTLDFIQDNHFVRTPVGRVLKLYGSPEDMAKIALATIGQGGGADIIHGIILRFFRELQAVPALMVHDSLMFEIPRRWNNKRAYDFISLMYEETGRLAGLKVPGKCTRGPNYGKLEPLIV